MRDARDEPAGRARPPGRGRPATRRLADALARGASAPTSRRSSRDEGDLVAGRARRRAPGRPARAAGRPASACRPSGTSSRFPAVADDPELALDLIYSEFLLREAAGESPALEEYAGAVPAVRRGPGAPGRVPPRRSSAAAGTARSRRRTPALVGRSRRTRRRRAEPARVPGYEILGELGCRRDGRRLRGASSSGSSGRWP